LLWLPTLNSVAGFKVTEKKNGVHVARNDFRYPIRAVRIDPNAVYGDTERCMHFAFGREGAEQNLMGSYGSHLLFCALIPPRYAWTHGRCLHGSLTVPLSCLSCGEGDAEPEIVDGWAYLPPAGDPWAWMRQLPVVGD